MIQINKKDYIWSYVSTVLNVSINVIMMPFILAFLNDNELGLWYVYASISALIVLLDFGFAPTVARNIAFTWSGVTEIRRNKAATASLSADIDWELFRNILTTCRLMYVAISIIAAVLMMTLGTWYVSAIAGGSLGGIWEISWAFYAAGIFLNLLYGYLNAFLRGVGAIAEISKSQIAARMAQLILTVGTLFFGLGIVGTAAAYLVSGAVLRFTGIHLFRRYEGIGTRLKEVKSSVSISEVIPLFNKMWSNAWRDGLVSISVYLCTQANTLICSYILGLSSTGSYGLSVQIANIIANVSSVWYSTNQPKMQECVAKGDCRKNTKIFGESLIIYFIVGGFLTLIAVTLGIPVINFIKKDSVVDITLLLVLCIYTLLYKLNNLFASCISNFNTIPYYLAFVMSGFASAALSAFCARFTILGIWSLVVVPFGVLLVYNFWKWPRVAFELLKTSASSCFAEGTKSLKNRIESLCL